MTLRRGASAGLGRPRRSAAAVLASTVAVVALDAPLLALALGGPLRLLEHPRALALLACWLGGGLVLAWIRPDRSEAAAETRREPRLLMLALFLIPLLTPVLAAYGERARLLPLPGGLALRWAGVAISAFGFGVRIAAMRTLGARFSPFVALQPGHVLETRGIYARVRHPGYAGSLLATLGAVLAFGSALGLPPVALMAALLVARIGREESMMESHFGDAWRDYRRRSGALLPPLPSFRGGNHSLP